MICDRQPKAPRRFWLLGLLLLSGCAAADGESHAILSQAPIDSIDLRGDYQAIAGCAYAKFTDGTSEIMNRNEFPEQKQTRLALMGGSTKAWELILTQASPSRTHIELTAVQTMWGPDKVSSQRAIAVVRECDSKSIQPRRTGDKSNK